MDKVLNHRHDDNNTQISNETMTKTGFFILLLPQWATYWDCAGNTDKSQLAYFLLFL
jgi:hypothetical protein